MCDNKLVYTIHKYMSLLNCYKLFFSFKAFITIHHFLFIFAFVCLTFERRKREEEVGKGGEAQVGVRIHVACRKRKMV